MVELAHRRLDVRREKVGVNEAGVRGATSTPGSVEEAIGKLREHGARVEKHMEAKREREQMKNTRHGQEPLEGLEKNTAATGSIGLAQKGSKGSNAQSTRNDQGKDNIPEFARGRLIHRTEPELRTHTSYLVFAILPVIWTDEDEARCRAKWGTGIKASQDTSDPK
jgi:tRNA (adenine57-N1/adenine58-N1)-methyltransferase catalytic subunit